MKIALTIAGSDSGGGAGIQADLKTFQQFGVFGTSVIVALTAQNTRGVRAVEPCPEAMVARAARRAGRGSAAGGAQDRHARRRRPWSRLVGKAIRENGWSPLVVDPVMVSTSGAPPAHAGGRRRRAREPAAARRPGHAQPRRGRDPHRPRRARRGRPWSAPARRCCSFGAGAALVKGGHLAGDEITDLLVTPDGTRAFRRPRIDTSSTHGTGCTLSAAITAGLALGRDLETAVADALDYVHRAIAAAPGLGGGHGPLDHTCRCQPDPCHPSVAGSSSDRQVPRYARDDSASDHPLDQPLQIPRHPRRHLDHLRVASRSPVMPAAGLRDRREGRGSASLAPARRSPRPRWTSRPRPRPSAPPSGSPPASRSSAPAPGYRPPPRAGSAAPAPPRAPARAARRRRDPTCRGSALRPAAPARSADCGR